MTKTPQPSPDTEDDRRRWSRRPESRPAEILKAAFAVFTEAGYERTTIADVAFYWSWPFFLTVMAINGLLITRISRDVKA